MLKKEYRYTSAPILIFMAGRSVSFTVQNLILTTIRTLQNEFRNFTVWRLHTSLCVTLF